MALKLPADEPLNINISAYRVLYILLLLVQYRSLNAVELNRLLSENPLIQRIYNNETLTKYINTLREVGCDIPRSSGRNDYNYELQCSPFPMALDPEECRIAEKLLRLLAVHPDEALFRDYRDFLAELAWSVQMRFLPAEEETKPPFPELEARRQQLQTYRRYCREAFTLQVRYRDADGQTRECQVEPHETVERGKQLLLRGLDTTHHEPISLDVEHIQAVRQLPCKNRRQAATSIVTFALYGRLAQSYRLYPDEKVIYRKPGELHVKAKVQETTALLGRLLKYGSSCQVLSPDSVRQEMRQRIAHLLDVLNKE